MNLSLLAVPGEQLFNLGEYKVIHICFGEARVYDDVGKI